MDASQSLSAFDVVNGYDLDRLTEVIRRYSDERFAHRIAKAIIAARTIETTSRLAEVVAEAIPAPARRTGGHPAKRTFQALRIEVNAELDVLPAALQAALDATASGGRLAVLSYHSGEDRIVKHVFAEAQRSKGEVVASPFVHPESVQGSFRKVRAAQKPSREEMDRNPRASSARLRVIEKVGC
jgi:16S rRNA (cytosine1402-N4)-methyltransferase